MGYGLVLCIIFVFGYGVKMLGVCFEKVLMECKMGIVGWYNIVVFYEKVKVKGLYVEIINGDVFFDEIKNEIIEKIKVEMGKVDLVIYSFVFLCRIDLEIGVMYKFMFKFVGQVYIMKIYDIDKDKVYEVLLELVNDEEIFNIIKVMGGEDWECWMDFLCEVDVFVEGCKIIVYIYIGKELIWFIYG